MDDPADGQVLADWDDHLTLAFREASALVAAYRFEDAASLLQATANSARVANRKQAHMLSLPADWVASLHGRIRLLSEAGACLQAALHSLGEGDSSRASFEMVEAGDLIRDSRGEGTDPRVLAYWTVVADAADELRLSLGSRIADGAP